MLAVSYNEHQNEWGVQLPFLALTPHVFNTATGLAPNEGYVDQSYGGFHPSLDRGQLGNCDLARERQQRVYELV